MQEITQRLTATFIGDHWGMQLPWQRCFGKNLRKLCLRYVCIDDETLEKIMSGCSLLEHVSLVYCKELKAIKVANKNIHALKHFEFSCLCEKNNNEHSLEIDVRTLQSISISRCRKWYRNHNNYFPHLKSLDLYDVQLSNESFYNFSSNFPCLEELTLLQCSGFEEIRLSSSSIKRLTIQSSWSIKKVSINAPHILYFQFSSYDMPTTFSLATTNSCREWKSHLDLSYVYACTDVLWKLRKLIETVKTLSQSQISLTLSDTLFFNVQQIEWDFSDHPIVVEHLVLNMFEIRPDSLPPSLNALFRIFRPRYTYALRLHHNDEKEATELLWKTLIHEREKREYGWEQHLEEVSIEASDEKGEVWHHVEWTYLPEWSDNLKIRFRLKWRD